MSCFIIQIDKTIHKKLKILNCSKYHRNTEISNSLKYQIQNELEISNNSLSINECVREPDSLLWNIERIVRKSTLFEYYFSKIIHLEKCIDIIKFHIITAPSFSPCMSQTLSSEFSNSIVLELYNWPRTLLSSNFIDLEFY